MSTDNLEQHIRFMKDAIAVAGNCRSIQWYGVGCVIVGKCREIISTGFTGELTEDGKHRHAEDVAIEKAVLAGHVLLGTTLYSTLEPCSVRASGKTPCVTRIIDAEIGTVVFGSKEPFDPLLNITCEGEAQLRESRISVIHLRELADECLKSAISNRCSRNV